MNKKILQDLDIDTSFLKFTKQTKKPKFSKVKDHVPQIEDFNFQADLIMLPQTKAKYRYLLTVLDLATNECDFEPLKTKEPKEVLSAIQRIFKRPYLNMPFASIRTDAGNEFKGEFEAFLNKNDVIHPVTQVGRHKQTGSIEGFNRQVDYILTAYMNSKEIKTGKLYREWTDIIDQMRTEMNKIRKRDVSNYDPFALLEKAKKGDKIMANPKFQEGDLVHVKLDRPKNALGQNIEGRIRVGDFTFDRQKRRIVTPILSEPDNPRYVISGLPSVSYTEQELMLAEPDDINEETQNVYGIIGKKTVKKKDYYLVWWEGELKKQATWEPEENLIEDGLEDYIDQYYRNLEEEKQKKKAKAKPKKR